MPILRELIAARLLDSLVESCEAAAADGDDHEVTGAVTLRHSAAFRRVVRTLRAEMDAGDLVAILGLILDLIQIVGPVVDEILKRIRDRHRPARSPFSLTE